MFKRGGSAASRKPRRARKKTVHKKIDELILPASKLKFCAEQLQNLNFIFSKRLNEEPKYDQNVILARSVTERLVQRLVCGVGSCDKKFSSKFLINLHNNSEHSTNLQYLIRLDSLSTPALVKSLSPSPYSIIENDPDCPRGYARLRMFTSFYQIWGEYTNAQGFLRRDKIQAKYVELLAAAAASDTSTSPSQLEEAHLCASPGKVVDASTLHNILKTSPEEQTFYGSNGAAPRFPDPRDFRLAIVDEPDGIRLRVEFLSPALSSVCINVRLMIAIECESWPSTSGFPVRIPLGHSDSLLYQQTAQTGVYFVGYGVQSSAWQMRVISAEENLLKNYSPNSTVHNIIKILNMILSEVYIESARHQRYQYTYKILNDYIFKTCLLYELEKDFNSPTMALLNWSPQALSVHVLKILDNLIVSLRRQRQPNYFFPGANLLANPGHLCEDDYVYHSKLILAYLVKLFDSSLVSFKDNEDFEKLMVAQELEVALLCRWKELIDGLMPPGSTRGRRFCFAGSRRREVAYTQYTARQIDYLTLLFENMLRVRTMLILPYEEYKQDGDLVYILTTIMIQARELYLKNNPLVKRLKLSQQFDPTLTKFKEIVKRANETFDDYSELVKIVLKWLYKALDHNKRLLGPILRPYMTILFIASHGNSWFLEAIRHRSQRDEAETLGTYAKLVNDGKITPAAGLVDCVGKNWTWAKAMLQIIEKEDIRLVFIDQNGKTTRHMLSVPTKNTENKISIEREFSTLPKKNYFCTILRNVESVETKIPWHCVLRDNSPLTKIYQNAHRFGDHRCGGDIVQTLISMQKLNILQDLTNLLPQEDREQLLELMAKFSNDKRRHTMKKRAQTLPAFSSFTEYQKYTPKEESAGIKLRRRRTQIGMHSLELNGGALIGCRTLREDLCEGRRVVRSKESFRK